MARDPALVTLIRHPETTANVAHLLQGVTDSPWTVQGQHQAKRLTDAIQKTFTTQGSSESRQLHNVSPLLRPGRSPTHLWASPLGRTKRLAEQIHETLRSHADECSAYACPAVVERPGLQERSFGPSEGKSSRQSAISKAVREQAAHLHRAESSVEFRKRVHQEYKDIQTLIDTCQDDLEAPSMHIVIVSHGLWIRTFLELCLGRTQLPFTNNTGIFTLELSKDGSSQRFRLVCQNDTSHLTGLKRQRGGIGSSAVDQKQQTLQQLWQPASKKR